MKKVFLFLFLILSITELYAQESYISFQKVAAGNQIDSIVVTNLRSKQKVKIVENEQLLLAPKTGIESIDLKLEKAIVSPNPCENSTELIFRSVKSSEVSIRIYNSSGRIVNLKNQNLESGIHRFKLVFPAQGIYFVHIVSNENLITLKTISTGSRQSENKINYEGSEFLTSDQLGNSEKSLAIGKSIDFSRGDVLYYSAYSGKNNTIIVDSPLGTKVYPVEFFECKDLENKNYPIVKINGQWWMAKNLAYLPSVNPVSLSSDISSYYYVYGYDGTNTSAAKSTANYLKYGTLYNWNAAMNNNSGSTVYVQGACPANWHLPSDSEWTMLTDYLGGENEAGGKLKETGITNWLSPNEFASDIAGFSALPGGFRNNGFFTYLNSDGLWWTSSIGSNPFIRSINFNRKDVLRLELNKGFGLSVRCVMDMLPKVRTTGATDITQYAAKSGGIVDYEGVAPILARGICWSKNQNPDITNSKTTDGNGTGSFTSSISGLTTGTTYFVRAYATNSQGTAYGNQVIFTTLQSVSLPVVTTAGITGITPTTGNGGGNVTSDGGATVTARGVCWSTNQNPDITNSKTTDGNGTGSFTSSISGLTSGTTYFVRAYATNSQGTAYGNQVIFTTLQSVSLPVVTTAGITGITPTTGNGGGNVTSDGGATVTARGVCWSTNQNPDITNSKTTDGNGTGSFTSSISGLTSGTAYFVRAYATNSQGTAYGNQVIFTTLQSVSLPVVTTAGITGITPTTGNGGGNVTSDGGATVTAKGVCWSTNQNPDITNSKTTDGNGTGSFTSSISGLISGTTYYLRAYATNSQGTAYGNQVIFTTLQSVSLPVVTTAGITGITPTTGNGGGNVTSDGGATVTARGVCWSTNQNPDITNSKTTDGNGTGSFTSSISGLTKGTTYFVRAYATNSQGTAYGNQVIFTTLQSVSLPVVTTAGITGITPTTGNGGGNVTSDGGATVTARGVCWSTNQNPDITNSKTTDGNGTGSFTSSISGLTSGTTYYIRAYATNSQGTAYGNQVIFTTLQSVSLPVVTTAGITGITQTTGNGGGNVTSDGGATVTARGVCWSTNQNPDITNSKTTDGNGTGSFTSSVSGLTSGTTYYLRAYATNSQGTAYGTQVSFTTLQQTVNLPVISTLAINSITQNSAYSGGNVTSDGGAPVISRGVCWSTSSNPLISNNKTTDSNGTGTFISSVTNLLPNTVYYLRAYATNSIGTSYGNELTFTTQQFNNLPVIYTSSITGITQSGANSGGEITSDGGSAVIARGVCWSVSQNPDISGNKTNNGTGTGNFSSNISGLTPGTTYYVRAYASNSIGTAYGVQLSFTTQQLVNIPTLTTNNITSITQTTAATGGNITSDGGAVVISRGVCWSTAQNPDITGSKTSDGSGIGSFSSNITGLTAGTVYFVRAYATNSAGTAYGNQMMFTSQPPINLPTLTTTSITDITQTTATSGGDITSDGGSAVTARGVCWSLNPLPDISNSKTTNGSGIGAYISSLTGLVAGTTYFVRAYATNISGTSYGEQYSFTTTNSTSLPNFYVTQPTLSNNSPQRGESTVLNFKVGNNGKLGNYMPYVGVFGSQDLIIDAGDISMKEDKAEFTNGITEIQITETQAIPFDITPGDYYIICVINYKEKIQESSELDNTKYIAIKIR